MAGWMSNKKSSNRKIILISLRRTRNSISLVASYFPSCFSRSIIGAGWFHYRVRDGIVCVTPAITTKPTEFLFLQNTLCKFLIATLTLLWSSRSFSSFNHLNSDLLNQANRVISTSKLHALLRFHTWPINVVVFHDSNGDD